jgi:tetratricopeptide (TPR) repeat protein
VRRAAAAALLATLAACASQPLGDPSTARARAEALAAEGEHEDLAELGERVLQSPEVSAEDKAEVAFLAAEAEFARGRHGAAFERYRWVLENAPWSAHAAAIEGRLFESGQVMLFGEEYSGWFDDRGKGVDVLETLAAHFRASDRADDALKLVGDYFADPEVKAWGEASLSYLRVVDEYPGSEWAERCLWLAGRCRLQEAQGPQYDRNELLRAQALLQRSLSEHPRGVALAEARADLSACRESLARAELVVADFYAARGVPAGELLRLVNASALYPDTPAGREAAQRLAGAGLDPAALARDPRRNSVDTVTFVLPRWEREAEEQRGKAAAGKEPR